MFRLLVAGGRNFYDYRLLDSALTEWLHKYTSEQRKLVSSDVLDEVTKKGVNITIVNGDASGADRLSTMWARYNDLKVECFPADWKKYGASAGPLRNSKMIDSGIDYAILFEGGRGTKNMKSLLRESHISFQEVIDRPSIQVVYS